MKYLITIVGPTAIGKTSLAICLANHYSCEIISADSRQFFKEMNIGTAVPSFEELSQAKHHFIQHRSIFENYSVGDFERDVIGKLTKIYKKNNFAILVGGSGLYIDAVLKGLDDFPEVSAEVRQNLQQKYEKEGIFFLQKKLQALDIEQFNNMDIHNPQRLMRALEVCISSGKPYSSFLKKNEKQRDFISIEIGLTASRLMVYERIQKRVDVMMNEGLLCEAQKLFQYRDLNALQTVGYRELFDFLEGKSSLSASVENIKTHTRQFAKRQYTWFLKNQNIQWFNFQQDINKIINFINQKKDE